MSNNEQVDRAFEILRDCFKAGGKLLLCGNGGSAADCDHIAAELVKGMTKKRAIHGLPAISLCGPASLLTAILNDIGPDWVFAQQVLALGKPGDVLLAISTSGKSRNIHVALDVARKNKMKTVLLTGAFPSTAEDAVINVYEVYTPYIQERHVKIYHELCARLEEEFFP